MICKIWIFIVQWSFHQNETKLQYAHLYMVRNKYAKNQLCTMYKLWVLVFTKYDYQKLRIFREKWRFSPKYWPLKDQIAICTSAEREKQVCKISSMCNVYRFWVLVFTKYDSQNQRIFMGKWSFSLKYLPLCDQISICTSADGEKQVCKISSMYNV